MIFCFADTSAVSIRAERVPEILQQSKQAHLVKAAQRQLAPLEQLVTAAIPS